MRPQTTSSLPSRFNNQVQPDTLWIDGQPVLHLIDVATRLSEMAPWQHSSVIKRQACEATTPEQYLHAGAHNRNMPLSETPPAHGLAVSGSMMLAEATDSRAQCVYKRWRP
eukprot:3015101-Amphidinium_carterae.1